MLKNEEIIYIANDWVTENKTSSHHIAEILARENKILYVEASGQRAPRASKRDLKKILKKLRKAWMPPQQIQKNFYIFSPFILPFHKFILIQKLNSILLRTMFKKAYRVTKFRNPILWIFLPHFLSIVDSINSKAIVYYCVDEYSSQPNVNAEIIKKMELDLLKKADVVFTVSENLYEKKRKINPNTYLSPHGVDVQHFRTAIEEETQIPEDIESIQKPIAGFFGLIEEWIDLNLVNYIASNLKHISFVFIGRVAQDVSFLRKNKNIHFLGPRPYELLPNYLKAFDVCLLPYKLNTQVLNSNPKKLREYLAGGKPVVSVRVREIENYKELVYIADSYEEFVRCINLALTENSLEKVKLRIKSMEKESWEAKVERISQIVSRHIINS